MPAILRQRCDAGHEVQVVAVRVGKLVLFLVPPHLGVGVGPHHPAVPYLVHQQLHVRLAQTHQAEPGRAVEGVTTRVGRHVGQHEAVQTAWCAKIARVAVRRLPPAVHHARKPHLLAVDVVRRSLPFQLEVVPRVEAHVELALRDLLEIGGDVGVQDVHPPRPSSSSPASRRPRTNRARPAAHGRCRP